MADSGNTQPHEQGNDLDIPAWDPLGVLRERADAARADRDASTAELRRSMSVEEILDQFGLNLGEIED